MHINEIIITRLTDEYYWCQQARAAVFDQVVDQSHTSMVKSPAASCLWTWFSYINPWCVCPVSIPVDSCRGGCTIIWLFSSADFTNIHHWRRESKQVTEKPCLKLNVSRCPLSLSTAFSAYISWFCDSASFPESVCSLSCCCSRDVQRTNVWWTDRQKKCESCHWLFQSLSFKQQS